MYEMENDCQFQPEEITPEEFDDINEFLNNVNHFDLVEETQFSKFSNRGDF